MKTLTFWPAPLYRQAALTLRWLFFLLLLPALASAQTPCPEIRVTVSPAGPLTLCPGGSVTLTATAVIGGLTTGTGFNGDVYASAFTPDYQVLVGGAFTAYNGTAGINRFVRMNPDGTPDATYHTGAGFNGPVRALMVQPDGKVLVGGDFTSYDGTAGVNYLARLNRDGTLDTGFRPGAGLGAAAGNGVFALALLSDGRVLAGGQFDSYDGTTGLGNLVLLSTTGTRDATFSTGPGFDAPVRALIVAEDNVNLAMVGGDFTHYRGTTVGRLARLRPSGALDVTYPIGTGFNGPVLAMRYAGPGLVIGGDFTSFNGTGAGRLFALNGFTGLPLTAFNATLGAGFNGPVRALATQYYDKVLVGGTFTSFRGVTFNDHNLVRVNVDGTQDFAYNTGTGFDASVHTITYYPTNNKAVVGGAFTAYNGTAGINRFVRLTDTGGLNNADEPAPAGLTYSWNSGGNGFGQGVGNTITITQPGIYKAMGIIIDGVSNCAGTSLPVALNPPLGPVQLTSTGGASPTADLCAGASTTLTASATTVGAGFDGNVLALAQQPDGKMLVGGYFTAFNGVPVPRGLTRLNTDGSPDATFNGPRPGEVNNGFTIGTVDKVLLLPDGKIIVASGYLGTYNNDPTVPHYLARLNADGTPDYTFNPGGTGTYGSVYALARQPDGKFLVGGYNYLWRVNADGTRDLTFNAGGTYGGINPGLVTVGGQQSYAFVSSVAVQPDGKILVGGLFTEYNNNPASPDFLMRLNADGSLDLTFNPGGVGFDHSISTINRQPDGKWLIGGSYMTYNGSSAVPRGLLRLNVDGSVDGTFNPGGTGYASGFRTLALLPDGRMLIGGGYGYNGRTAPPFQLQRLSANGIFDTTFNPNGGGFDDGVYAIIPLPTGQILVGGAFTRYNYDNLAPDHYLRLSVDGQFDNPALPLAGATYLWADGSTSAARTITRPGNYSVEVTADGCSRRSGPVVIGTVPLTQVQVSPAGPVALPAGGSVTLTASAVRPAFRPGTAAPNNWVQGLAIQADGKVLVGGRFTATTGGVARLYRSRYQEDGSLDNTFAAATPALDGAVFGLTELFDGRVLTWGEFTTYAGTPRPGIVRLQADGTLDNTFAPTGSGLNGAVTCALVLFDGKILVGGLFTSYNGTARPYVARLNPDGSLDNTFATTGTGFNGQVTTLAERPDGSILVGGLFTSYSGSTTRRLARLRANGTLDNTFQSGGLLGAGNLSVNKLVAQPDGKVLVGGQFTSYDGEPYAHVVRIDGDGNLDYTFTQTGTGFNAPVNALALQPDGKILVGGLFTSYGGTARAYVARLNANGTLDNTFTNTGSGLNSQLNILALQSDGQVLVGGLFTSYNGIARNYLARLNADGSLNDTATPVTGATFSWSPGGSTNPFTVTTAGTYTPTATLTGGCTIIGDAVVVGASSLPDLVVSTLENVTGDYNNVTVTGPAMGGAGTATLTGPLTVAGTLTIQPGGTLLTACQPLTGTGNFVLEAGGTLGICDPVGITLSGATGSVQLAGTRSYSDDAMYIYNGTVAQVSGNGLPALVRELEVNNAHTLGLTADVDLRQVLRLRAGDLILLGHNVTLRSGPAGTALVDNQGGNVLNGPGLSRMQRYLDPTGNAGLGYRHYASPLLTTPVSQLTTTGFTPVLTTTYNTSATPGQTTPFPTVYAYDEARVGSSPATDFTGFDKGWWVPTDFGVGRGLTVNLAPPALVTFSGFFNGNPSTTVPLSRGPQAEAGWHLLGNPYPAPFDLGAAGATTTVNVGAAAYVFESSGQYAGQYRTLVNGIGNGPQVIAAGQGFFVRTATAGLPSSFRFNAAGRVTTFAAQPTFQRGTADTRPQVQLAMATGSSPVDVAYIYAEGGATPGIDPAFDATKIMNPGNASVYAVAATGESLAVQGLSALTATTVVPLAIVLPAAGPATFTATLANLPAGLTAFLTDATTGTRQNLAANATYSFTAPAGSLAGRFALVFGPASGALGTAAAQGATLALYPNPAHISATLTLPAAATARVVRVLDALGREVRQLALPAQAATVTLDCTGLPTGVYAVRCGTAAARLVVE